MEQEQTLTIYPNPVVNGVLTVQIPENIQTDVIHIYDFRGQLVVSKVVGASTTDINVSHLSNGMYVVRVGAYTEKFVKQ
jgi:hypothetical protein